MRIAYVSPLNPTRSGISDFSEELIGSLRQHADIDLFCHAPPTASELSDCPNYKIAELDAENTKAPYDVIVYHIGNNPHHHQEIIEAALRVPGIVELHDFSLHVFLANVTLEKGDTAGYLSCIRHCHGEMGVRMVQKHLAGKAPAPWEEYSLELLANKYLIDAAKGVIVHSDMAKQMVKAIRPEVPVVHIPLHTIDILDNPIEQRKLYRKALGISASTLVFGSFGFVTPAKRIYAILQSLSRFKQHTSTEFCYYLVGDVEDKTLFQKIEHLGIKDNVVITGFVSLEQFKLYMGACDVCINLRYPTQGETSGSLHRLFGMGTPVLVTDVGAFQEYPDEFVLKVRHDTHEVDDIYNHLYRLAQNPDELLARSQACLAFAKHSCSLEKNTRKYMRFFQDVQLGGWQDDWVDRLVDALMACELTDLNTTEAQRLIAEAIQLEEQNAAGELS